MREGDLPAGVTGAEDLENGARLQSLADRWGVAPDEWARTITVRRGPRGEPGHGRPPPGVPARKLGREGRGERHGADCDSSQRTIEK